MADGSFFGSKPQMRDLEGYAEGLSAWVSSRLSDDEPARMTSIEPTSLDANGFAGETFVLHVARGEGDREQRKRWLLKRKPTRHRYFPEHDFEAEYRIQAFLAADGRVPLAPFGGHEADPAILGSPFYLIGFVDGRAVPDRPVYHESGWLADLAAADQHAVCASGLAALAAVHAVPLEGSGAAFLRRAPAGTPQIDWDLAYWDRFCAVAWDGEPAGRVAEGRAWLERNKPEDEDLVISWGDARPGNILFDGTRATAVIDWDMVSAGDREKDLGYWLAMDCSMQRFAEQGTGVRLTGWPSRGEMVGLYEEAAGLAVDQRKLRYHRIFAAYQIACMFARYVTMRKDLDSAQRARFLNSAAPPIALIGEELDAAHLPGSAK